jgi:hypothetical protein
LTFLDHPNAETAVPEPWKMNDPEMSKEAAHLMKMAIVKVLRPDRFISAT